MADNNSISEIYKLNSDINRITSQLRQLLNNHEQYESDVDVLSQSYLSQLSQKASQLHSLTNSLTVQNAG